MNIKALLAEIAAAPPYAGLDRAIAVAILNDLFRKAGGTPLPDPAWDTQWRAIHAVLAHWASTTRFGESTVQQLRRTQKPEAGYRAFNEAVEALNEELILSNAFRREEILRHWAAAWGLAIEGETPAESKKRLETLDYRRTLKEFARAEESRKSEEAARLAALAAAQAAEEAARGWRE